MYYTLRKPFSLACNSTQATKQCCLPRGKQAQATLRHTKHEKYYRTVVWTTGELLHYDRCIPRLHKLPRALQKKSELDTSVPMSKGKTDKQMQLMQSCKCAWEDCVEAGKYWLESYQLNNPLRKISPLILPSIYTLPKAGLHTSPRLKAEFKVHHYTCKARSLESRTSEVIPRRFALQRDAVRVGIDTHLLPRNTVSTSSVLCSQSYASVLWWDQQFS